MQRVAVYAGSFDPPTNGHLNIIERASALFDRLIVTVARNTSKKVVFTEQERRDLLMETCGHLGNIETDTFSGLLVEYARSKGAAVLVRGIRSFSDYEYEFQMALTNRDLNRKLDTVFLITEGQYAHISSSLIKEIVSMGGSVTGMVPPRVEQALRERIGPKA